MALLDMQGMASDRERWNSGSDLSVLLCNTNSNASTTLCL
jgi:hypothetical protein